MKIYINIILMILVDMLNIIININLFTISLIFIFVPLLWALYDSILKKNTFQKSLKYQYEVWGNSLHGNMLVNNQYRR